MRAWIIALVTVAAGCGGGGSTTETVHLGDVVDQAGEGVAEVELDAPGEVVIELDGEARVVEVAVAAEAACAALDEEAAECGDAWFRPRPVTADRLTLALDGEGRARVQVFARGAPAPAARRERSLVWTDGAILDDPAAVGLARVLGAAAEDGHGGRLLEAWLARFATTSHSERAGPALLLDQIRAEQGEDAAAWDLDALPFRVTGVHNRIDLAARGGGCGELRVSLASTDPIYAPFHMLFLFRQEPAEDDVAPSGAVHCLGTARRWARLAALDGGAFAAAARAWLDGALQREAFLMAETVELTVSPWEWRQWAPVDNPDAATAGALPRVLDNPPLFQTIDVERLDQAGALRDDFLDYVAREADGLAARTALLPARFRPRSARVAPGTERPRIDLTGLDAGVAARYPDLADDLELPGCPACHTTDAEFVQTAVDRTFSPFYDRELDARAARLDAQVSGEDVAVPPFGPLSD